MTVYIDSDSHLTEPSTCWHDYVPADFRPLVPQIVEKDGVSFLMSEGRIFTGFSIAAASSPGALGDSEKSRNTRWDDVPLGGRDPKARLQVLDVEGLTATVLYPSIGLTFQAIHDPSVARVASESYNNWVSDFCKTDRQRLYAAGTVPLQDVNMAVRELERVKKLDLCATTVRPTPYNGRRLNDPAYDRFWAAAQELEMPISVHGSFAVGDISSVAMDRYPHNDLFFSHIICHPLELQMASMDILCGGVLARFPKLKIAFLEAGAGWVLYWLDRLDTHFEKLGRFIPWQKEKPSDLFMRNCFVNYDADETTLKYIVDRGLAKNILWGADYPHYDCLYPGALKELR
ncbi:MAG: amidohydrolase family protein, partial [Candidatus Binataceae bacterium]